MKIALAIGASAVVAFAGGWFAHKETAKKSCYVIPAYTESTSSLLRPSTNAPELVCK